MNNSVFAKTMENVRKHRNIKLVTTKRRRNYLLSEPNYDTLHFFKEDLLAIGMRKIQILMNKSAHLHLSILDMSKSVMYEFWYDYVKPKYGEKCKTLLYEYRQLHRSCKNRKHSQRHCRRC